MKKVLWILLFCFAKCYSQEIKTTCLVESDLPLLNYTQVQLFASNYNSLHNTSRKKHTKAYYINSKTFEFLDSFIHVSMPKYFGFNIYFISYRQLAARHQSLQNQSLLYVVPVYDDPAVPGKDTTADYSALDNFFNTLVPGYFFRDSLNKGIACYNECDSSIMAWTYNTGFTRLNERPGGTQGSDIFSLTTNRSTHLTRRSNYATDHSELGGKQTKWIYFDAYKISLLAEFLKYNGNAGDYPLIGIYYGSYNSLLLRRQAHKDQTVLVLVPMRKMDNGFFEPDICSLVDFWNGKEKNGAGEMKLHIGVNHGELCPENCPTGGN